MKKMLVVLMCVALFMCCSYAFAGESWVCPQCGAENSENFCVKCGTPKPEMMVCPACGEQYSPDSGVVFCGKCGTRILPDDLSSAKLEGPGFDTPEEALTCYMEGLKNLDFEQMLSAFAWETQAEHYSFEKFFNRIKTYAQYIKPRIPFINDFMLAVNTEEIRAAQIDMIYNALEAYILGEDYPNGQIIQLKEEGDTEALLRKFDNGRLEKLSTMGEIRFVSPDLVTNNKFSMPQNIESFKKQTAPYGANEAVNIVGIAEIGDEVLCCCPTICRYGEKWYLVSCSSMTSAILGIETAKQAFMSVSAEQLNAVINR